MAITPDEAKKLTADQKDQVEDFERQIDEGLIEGTRTFDLTIGSDKVKNIILDLYRNAGWSVSCGAKSEGFYKLVFSEYSTDFFGR